VLFCLPESWTIFQDSVLQRRLYLNLQVRNAATLCFSALLVRMLGFKNAALRTAARGSLTLPHFLSRYPSLHPFLLAQLDAATRGLRVTAPVATAPGAPEDCHWAGAAAHTCHPALHPLLILLTRLRPVNAAADALRIGTAALPLQPFAPLLARCCAAPLHAVRELAARALAALITPKQLHAELASRVAALPADGAQLCSSPRGHPGGLDGVHGALCVLRDLLLLNVAAAPGAQAAQMLGDAVPALLRRLRLADAASSGCPAVSRAFVQVLAAAKSCIADVASSMRSPALRRELLAHVHAARSSHSYMPMWSSWLAMIVRFVLDPPAVESIARLGHGARNSSGSPHTTSLLQDAVRLLGSAVSEVQAETMRCLVKGADWGGIHQHYKPRAETQAAWLLASRPLQALWDAVSELTASSQHQKVQRRALQLATCLASAMLPAQQAGAAQVEAQLAAVSLNGSSDVTHAPRPACKSSDASGVAQVLAHAARARQVLHGTSDLRVRSAALVCVATCVGGALFSADSDDDSLLSELHCICEDVVQLVERCAAVAHSDDDRLAAATALSQCRLLAHSLRAAGAWRATWLPLSLRAWNLALDLIEDEDFDVRCACNAFAASFVRN
jgi:hypothetical protein